MTKKQFVKKVKALGIDVHWYQPKDLKPRSRWEVNSPWVILFDRKTGGYRKVDTATNKNLPTEDRYVWVQWSPGGLEGGNCWNDDRPTYRESGEPEPELTALDKILAAFAPNITFLQYKDLVNEVATNAVTHDSWSVYEYYGNSTDYRSKTLHVDKLYELLVQKKLL